MLLRKENSTCSWWCINLCVTYLIPRIWTHIFGK